MGRTGGSTWLDLVKKAFRSPSKDNQKNTCRRREESEQEDEDEEEKKRGKRRWMLGRLPTVHEKTRRPNHSAGNAEPSQRQTLALAVATAAAAEAAVEIIRLTRPSFLVNEHHAAIAIQSAFRGYLARKALGALRGVVMLQAVVRGHNARKRAKMTLQCMQSLVRVQTQVCDRRRRLSCEGRMNCSHRRSTSRTDLGATAVHRERLLAYAFSQQMWSSSKEEEDSKILKGYESVRRASFDQPIRTVEIDTAGSYAVHTPSTPPGNKIKPILVHSLSSQRRREETNHPTPETPNSLSSHFHRASVGRTPTSRPSYMAATASAKARSQSAPRQQRPSTPERENSSSAKKRLSFSVTDPPSIGYSSDHV